MNRNCQLYIQWFAEMFCVFVEMYKKCYEVFTSCLVYLTVIIYITYLIALYREKYKKIKRIL